MAKRHVTEEDLLSFRDVQDKHAKVIGEKYAELDAKNAPEPEPHRVKGVLLVDDGYVPQGFDENLKARGVAVERADINGYVPKDRFERTPKWERPLLQAQIGWQKIRERTERAYIVSSRNAVAIGALMAEQYPADGLFIVGGGVKRAGAAWLFDTASRLARRNLFAIVCPITVMLTDDTGMYTKKSAALFSTDTRSDDVNIYNLTSNRRGNAWVDCEQDINIALYEFLGV